MESRQVSYHFETNPRTELDSFVPQSPKLPGFIGLWLQVSQEKTSSPALLK